MLETPVFSIIIPTYNRQEYIVKAIESVLSQAFKNFETIVVDDGGNDGTEQIITTLNNPAIHYYWKENGERAAARNYGAQKATGQYITFLDSDDYLKPDHLTSALKCIQIHNSPEVFALGYDVVTPEGKIINEWKSLPNPVNDKLHEGNFLSCLGVFVRRDIFYANKFNEDRKLTGSEDYELWLRLAARHPIYILNKATACLVDHHSRSVVNFNLEQIQKRNFYFEYYLKNDNVFVNAFKRKLDKIFGYQNLYLALHLAMAKYKVEALNVLLKAFKLHPSMAFNFRFWIVIKKITVD